MSRSVARTVIALTTFLAIAGSCLQPAWAQACGGGPFLGPGGVAVVAPATVLAPLGLGLVGLNLVGVPGFSPFNAAPAAPGNGFVDLCLLFGLPTTASLVQINALNGLISSYMCGQPVAPPFQPCRGVIIRTPVGAAAVIPVDPPPAPDFEGTWAFTFVVEGLSALGDNYFNVPFTSGVACGDGDGVLTPAELCACEGLPVGTSVTRIQAGPGLALTHICGQVPQYFLVEGEAVLIRPTATVVGVMPIL